MEGATRTCTPCFTKKKKKLIFYSCTVISPLIYFLQISRCVVKVLFESWICEEICEEKLNFLFFFSFHKFMHQTQHQQILLCVFRNQIHTHTIYLFIYLFNVLFIVGLFDVSYLFSYVLEQILHGLVGEDSFC